MKSAAEWRRFYADERAALGERGLDALFDGAPVVSAPVVFPHTKLRVSGHLVAAAARAVLDCTASPTWVAAPLLVRA